MLLTMSAQQHIGALLLLFIFTFFLIGLILAVLYQWIKSYWDED